MQEYTLKVDPENSQLRLDIFLVKNLPDGYSRTFVQQLIESGQVLVNAKKVKSHHKILIDDEIRVVVSDEYREENVAAEDIPLDIFYEDETLLVINKPSGLLVHPATGVYSGTLVNALLHHCRNLSDVKAFPSLKQNFESPEKYQENGEAMEEQKGNSYRISRPGIVHRLDKETSGLMVVAKNNLAHVNLARQFEKYRVKKCYLALVEGRIEFDEGLIDASLGRHPRYHDKKAVAFDDRAKKAKTFYRVLKRFKNSTYVACFPKTGRTHQIRVHLSHLGHPILGDEKYGKKDSFSRLALHAKSLGFFHPGTTRFVEFYSVTPQEFLKYKG